MKHTLWIIPFFLLAKISSAQDTIIQTNGSRIIAVVQSVGTTDISYKKYENRQTSPVYTINKSDVNMIKYADGTKDVFNSNPPSQNHQALATSYSKSGIKKSPPQLYLSGELSLGGSFNIGNLNNFYSNRAYVISGSNSTYTIGQSAGFYRFDIGIMSNTPTKRDSSLRSHFGVSIGLQFFSASAALQEDQIGFGQFLTFQAQPRMADLSIFWLPPISKRASFIFQYDFIYGSIIQGEYTENYGGGSPSERDYTLSGSGVGSGFNIGFAAGGKLKVFVKFGFRFIAIPLYFTDSSTGTKTEFAVSNSDTTPVSLDLSGYSFTVGLLL